MKQVKAWIDRKVITVRVVNEEYDTHNGLIYGIMTDGNFAGFGVVIHKEDIISTKKITVSFRRAENHRSNGHTYRYFDISVKNVLDWKTSSLIINEIADKVNELIGYKALDVVGCPWEIGNEYGDGLIADVDEDDSIKEQMQDIMDCYKEAKRIVMAKYN